VVRQSAHSHRLVDVVGRRVCGLDFEAARASTTRDSLDLFDIEATEIRVVDCRRCAGEPTAGEVAHGLIRLPPLRLPPELVVTVGGRQRR